MKALILGLGYTGKEIQSQLRAAGVEVFSTRRTAQNSDEIVFDLNRSETWNNIPQVDYSFWTFPPEPLDLVSQFLELKGKLLGRIVLIGSTGTFLSGELDEVITETSPSNLEDSRHPGELEILKRAGILVRASGIYGPERNPIRWIESGRVGSSPKFVNFIHVEDLARIVIAASKNGKAGSTYIASDSHPYRWSELIEKWKAEFGIQVPENASPSKRVSKKLDAHRTLRELNIDLNYPSVIKGVRSL